MGLHFLERVIISLNEKAKGHNIVVPYRESLMTMVLRDSLGGNCKTRMIANISAFPDDVEESISTCKFAMRVAMIKNVMVRNERVDPALIIKRLKKENAELKAEIALLTGTAVRDHLDEQDMIECKDAVEKFIISKDPAQTIIMNDRLKIKECFFHFRHLYRNLEKKLGGGGGSMIEKIPLKQ
jgi:kinesin family protein 6/9